MTLSNVTVKFEDMRLGQVPALADAHAKIGVAASGPATPQRLTRSTQAREVYGSGPLASAAAVALTETAPVICVRVTASTAGELGAVTQTGTGTSVLTAEGQPADAYDIQVDVTRTGTATGSDAAVTITVEGSIGPERIVPADGRIALPGTGLTLVFAAGTLTAGDRYALSTTAPAATLSDVMATLNNLLDLRPQIRFVHILGTATPALVAAVQSVLDERERRNYYVHALLEARARRDDETASDYLAAIEAEFAQTIAPRVTVALDGGEVYNPLTDRLEDRSAAWRASSRRPNQPIGESVGRLQTGPMKGVARLRFDAASVDTTGRFLSYRTLDTRPGEVYLSEWPMLAAAGSDFDTVDRREVIDAAASAGYDAALMYLGDDVGIDRATGRILETEATQFEAYVTGRVQASLGTNVSSVSVVLDRAQNILATRHIVFDLNVIPLGILRNITMRVGMSNPYVADATATASAGIADPADPATDQGAK